MLVKKDWVKLAVLLIAGTALLSTVCFAAEPAPAAPVPVKVVQGVVTVTKDANNVINKVTLTAKDKVVYNVILDAKGIELGKALASKEVEVSGTISKEAGQETIKVLTFKAIEAVATPKAEPKPAPKAPEAK